MSLKFDITKPGDDVLTTLDKDKLFTINHNALKLDQNTSRKDLVPQNTVTSIAHGRAYIPVFMSFADDGTGRWYPISNYTTPGSINTQTFADSTYVYEESGAGPDTTTRTFIFVDKIL